MAARLSNLLGKLSSFSFFDSFKHASVYFLGTVLVQGLGIISLPVLTYFLTEEEYGITNVYMSYTLIASVLLSLNLEWSISRYFMEPDADKKGFMATIFTGIFIFFAFAASVIFFFRQSVSAAINLPENLIFWLLAYTYTNIIWFAYIQVRIVEKKSKELAIAQVLVQYIKFAAAIFGLWYLQKIGAEAYMGKILGEFFISVLAMFCFFYVLWPYFDIKSMRWSHLRYALMYSIPLVPYALGGQVLSSFDQWYINAELGHNEAGFYSFAYKIGLFMNGLLIALQNASVVQYTKWMDEGEYKNIARQAFSIHKMTLLAGLFLILFSVDAGTLLAAKASFRGSLTIVPIIVGGYIFYSIALLYSRAFNYKKINIYLTVILLSVGILNVFLNMEYIPDYGYKAAAYTTLFSYMVMALLSWLVADFLLKMSPLPLGKILLSLLPLAAITWAFYALGWHSIGMHWGIIGLKMLVFAAFGFLLFFKTIRKILGV